MMPELLSQGGFLIWILLFVGSVAIAVSIDRFLYYHRSQINSTEFLIGIRNVLRNNNIVEAIAICDATAGPVAKLVKTAIQNREKTRDEIRQALEETGLVEVPKLEERLGIIATIAQISPILGFLGTVLGFIKIFRVIETVGPYPNAGQLASGIWQALISAAMGLIISAICYASYNFLVYRVNSIVLDMERTAGEILDIVTKPGENK